MRERLAALLRVTVVFFLIATAASLTAVALAQSRTFASGTVLDENGAPVVGARVCNTTTDSSGNFVLSIDAGERRIGVVANGFDAAEQPLTVVVGQPSYGLKFVLRRNPNSVVASQPSCSLGDQAPTLPTISDLSKDAPSSAGWRMLRWGMTVDEVLQTLPGTSERQKASKVELRRGVVEDAETTIQAKLKKKVVYDQLEYEVRFGFNKGGQLALIWLRCVKAKKESLATEMAAFTDLLGKPSAQKEYNPSGGVSVSGALGDSSAIPGFAAHDFDRTLTWNPDGLELRLNEVEQHLNILQTVRIISVIAKHVPK